MSTSFAIISIFVIAFFSVLYLLKKAVGQPLPVGYELAKEAIDKIKDWGIWMTGLQTGAIGALGLLTNQKGYQPDNFEQIMAFYSLVFFGTSTLLSTWVLFSLPSITYGLSLLLPHSLSSLLLIYTLCQGASTTGVYT